MCVYVFVRPWVRRCLFGQGQEATYVAHFRVLHGTDQLHTLVELVLFAHLFQVDPLGPVAACGAHTNG